MSTNNQVIESSRTIIYARSTLMLKLLSQSLIPLPCERTFSDHKASCRKDSIIAYDSI
jgi:hypothetical protein